MNRQILLLSLVAAALWSEQTFAQSSPREPGTDNGAIRRDSPAPELPAAPLASYVPHRVYNSKSKRFTDLEALIHRIANDADVVFLGEFHNDPGTHRLQLAILEGVARRRRAAVLALEMFERDVQPQLDAYLRGEIGEADFTGSARPWGNYTSDYRPLVELARAQQWPVVAGNVPRRLAQVVARRGLAALDSLPAADRAFAAQENLCPRDHYWERFRETMGDMSGHGMQLTPEQLQAMVWRTYEAQCVKDETMGEAVAAAHTARQALVIHANGSFHSDFRYGTAERVKWRLPKARMVVVSFVPVADLDAVDGKARRKLGDYVVFTLATPKPAAAR